MPPALKFDTAAAISKGGRDYQEDALITDFAAGADVSIAVLADGMGGHAAGDVASKVVVTEVFRELTFKRDAIASGQAGAAEVLAQAANLTNTVLAHLVEDNPARRGMGATLLGVLIKGNALHWISVGDSPLFLYRDNTLTQLNEDHSLATHIDFLVSTGALSAKEGAEHPERNVLTSVLSGEKIAQIDCPDTGFELREGDVILVASDGLQYLSDDEIAKTLRSLPLARSSEVSERLMDGLRALEDPDLDNVTVLTIQVGAAVRESTVPSLAFARENPDSLLPRWSLSRVMGKTGGRAAAKAGSR